MSAKICRSDFLSRAADRLQLFTFAASLPLAAAFMAGAWLWLTGKARDDFPVEWNGRRLMLDRHLKTAAKTRHPGYCFRLYFAWDDRDRQVVIGRLPGHMKT